MVVRQCCEEGYKEVAMVSITLPRPEPQVGEDTLQNKHGGLYAAKCRQDITRITKAQIKPSMRIARWAS